MSDDDKAARLNTANRVIDDMLLGIRQIAPGQPLLPPSYRGSADYFPAAREWVVSRGDELVGSFRTKLDAEQWTAWAAAERGIPVEEFRFRPVTILAKRRAGPLFDDVPLPPGPRVEGKAS